jgi:catechol 2,3-dioxygenase-like lactoylglutathione lyase family enzyme
MSDKHSPSSPPCLQGTADPQIDAAYAGLSPPPPTMLACNTILYCRDWAAMLHFYRDKLGFRPTFRKDDWFIELKVCEGAHLALADAARCSIAAGGGTGLTLSFRCAELAVAHQRLQTLGVAVTELRSHDWRAPYCYLHDPEGNRIELWNHTL